MDLFPFHVVKSEMAYINIIYGTETVSVLQCRARDPSSRAHRDLPNGETGEFAGYRE